MYYIFASFASEVPWKTCNINSTWYREDCWDGSLNESLKTTNDSRTPSELFFKYIYIYNMFYKKNKNNKYVLFFK